MAGRTMSLPPLPPTSPLSCVSVVLMLFSTYKPRQGSSPAFLQGEEVVDSEAPNCRMEEGGGGCGEGRGA